MLFVDGENLTIRGQQLAEARTDVVELSPQIYTVPYYVPDVLLWFDLNPKSLWGPNDWNLQEPAIRAHYYTSAIGDAPRLDEIRAYLRQIGFHPEIFQKPKGVRSKGVDISLTKDMLSHAFLDNYDAAVLIAGDADYIPLVREVQRLGKQVFLSFFQTDGLGLNPMLKVLTDGFHPLEPFFFSTWRKGLKR